MIVLLIIKSQKRDLLRRSYLMCSDYGMRVNTDKSARRACKALEEGAFGKIDEDIVRLLDMYAEIGMSLKQKLIEPYYLKQFHGRVLSSLKYSDTIRKEMQEKKHLSRCKYQYLELLFKLNYATCFDKTKRT